MSGEIDRDAWLDAALRHAPDAELGPSARLRAEILRQAHAAAQPRSAWLNPLMWIDALVARPALGAGLAGVFVATIVIALWAPWADAPVAEVASAPADAASAAPFVTAQAPAAATPTAPAAEPAREAAKSADARRERAAPRSDRPAAKSEAKREVTATAPAAPPPAVARAEEAKSTERRGSATGSVAAGNAADAAAPAAPAAELALPAAAPPPAAARAALRGRPEDLAPLTAPRRGLRTEPDAWSWQRGGNAPEPVNDALRQWLDKLDAATAGRWEVIDADPPGARALGTLTLLREERVHTIVRIESDGVSRRGAVRVRASLDPAAASALAAELRALSP